MATVLESTHEVLRHLGLTTVFGNPGSTEEPFLRDFPPDFRYVLVLQEASAVAMADGYAQATGRPAHVNLHTAPGVGNGMGNVVTAWHNKTPLIITAGQQTRAMLLTEPRLANPRAAELVQPYVKWSHEPTRAQDIPAAVLRAYASAVQPPGGPVLLSLPMDDWRQPAGDPTPRRTVSTRVAPEPERLGEFADVLRASRNPALVLGGALDRSDGWDAAVALAERLGAAVWCAPAPERIGFPEDHRQFHGVLPFAIGPLAERLAGYDTVLVVGAPVFRYYPYVPGDHLPDGTRLLHITDDPAEAARAPVGDSIIGDSRLACAALADLLPPSGRPPPDGRPAPGPPDPGTPEPGTPLDPDQLFCALGRLWPRDGVLVAETPSNVAVLRRRLPITRPRSYFATASGGLGFGLPAAVGIALAERDTGRGRPVVAVIGDGSFHYSVQALWTAARLQLPLVVLVPVNQQYGILKAFAAHEGTPGVPGLDLPGLDLLAIARGYGCAAYPVESADALAQRLPAALAAAGPTVLAAPITAGVPAIL
ncbi:benzoylformate decarboxylase [Plantactinospora sp. KBS50]|uniref:benzoylformate decarboxylase n=1 Tax=Plantactinospora sp. KBS50 TaxID=2024580 RepID=UPI001E3AABA2|nr:benzoylformate decarboxylase [Plantactinospora sp. KBS50]